MKASVVAVCLAALMCAGAASADNLFGGEASYGVANVFNAYLTAHGKSYSESEWGARMRVFYDNLKTIDELNAANGSPAFGVNKFTDMHPKEFRDMYLNYRPSPVKPALSGVYEPSALSRAAPIPSSMDWRNKGVITPVKNQAQCGSCWAFSTTEEIESRWAQAGHKLEELSVQQIVSCDNVDQGCNGGDTVTAYQYVMQAGGLESAAEYPYTSGGGDNGQCMFNPKDIVANITGFKWATRNSDETVMKHFIGTTGPLSTCVDASTWQFYTGGVISSGCGRQLDHCVQTVGYNTDNSGKDYWIVRNSWTTSWGENGYLYIEIGQDLCGIADEPTYVECPKAN